MRKFILPILVTLILSAISAHFIFIWLKSLSIDPMITNDYGEKQVALEYLKLFSIAAVYFFSLITIPFLLKDIFKSIGERKVRLWKVFIAFELFILILSLLLTPADRDSILVFFIYSQPIVLVNTLVSKRRLNSLTLD